MDAFEHAYCGTPPATVAGRAAHIGVLALDVDGVLTDGGVYIGDDGEPFKRFNIHDGKGIAMLRDAGIEVAIVTARRSGAVEARARELRIGHVHQGVRDKAAALADLAKGLGLAPQACAFVGDDLVDLAPMRAAGLAVAVANAHPAVCARAHWVTRRGGGDGAVREVCELLLGARGVLRPWLSDDARA
ncbi:HAD-IIIA family hydrolase [Arhodomonas aquaeolei]|uniref:KdsC family phosphatase n=1 Tax=Arhodomonas TaxID=2368 RepID=UPI0013D4EB9F|nr:MULTISPECIES: HAD-IIIA family hydrolase [Arhodomonas]MCS4504736.1 HAD-IIIA family hydrolase [Arhodomonas aquaeolei]